MKFAGAHAASRGVATAFVGVIATDFEAGAPPWAEAGLAWEEAAPAWVGAGAVPAEVDLPATTKRIELR